MSERFNLGMKHLAWTYIVSKKKNIVNYPYLIGISKKIMKLSLMIAKGCHFESVLATLSYVKIANISTQSCHNCCHLDHQ